MTSTSLELVHRLYRRLVEAARERSDEELTDLTIGDVYQHLVPYRGVRSELGVFELAEYENALLRLLAGEGDYLRVADERARSELAAELGSPNPILGIYRDYASLRVEVLRPDDQARTSNLREAEEPGAGGQHVREVTEFMADEPTTDEPEADEHATRPFEKGGSGGISGDRSPEPLPELRYPAPSPVPADATRVARPTPRTTGVSAPVGGESSDCLACGLPLPDVEGLRFCPHCGADQTAVACERCGAPIREEWNFCIRCGARRPAE